MSEKYEAVIGLEIHIQLKTRSKMFCSSPNDPFFSPENTNICEVCTGQPGTLPVANKEAIEKAVQVGLALGCTIAEHSKFDRKNYFYPDLPKGYQISQYDQPIASGGEFSFLVNGREKTVRITRAHLEEDTAKLVHEGKVSLVDFNRAGVPLLEIVTEPDFSSAEEVRQFLQLLRNLVRYLGVSDGDMEKGQLRGEPNISVRKVGQKDLPNYKVELKNLNSFRAVHDSLKFEIERQKKDLEKGGRELKNETRGWNGKSTTVQRVKEEAQDYRYFPEPDLPILHFSKEYVELLRTSLPELPNMKEKRFIEQFGLSEKDAEVLVADKNLAAYFEEVVSELENWYKEEGREGEIAKMAKTASNTITGEFQALLKQGETSPGESKVTAENMAELLKMVGQQEISKTAAKKILEIMFKSGGDPSNILEAEGLGQISDEGEIEQAVDEVIKENPQALEDYRAGKGRAIGFLVGQVMAHMKGKANPEMVNKILTEKLT